MPRSHSNTGPGVQPAGAWGRYSDTIGRTALRSTYRAIAKQSPATTAGRPTSRRRSGNHRRESSTTWSWFMSFSIAGTMRRLLAPHHELSCSWWTWRRLLAGLRARGRYVQESGAFLLGRRSLEGPARIDTFILYDDLDPRALDTGIIRFDGAHFGRLWEHCRKSGSTVLADVHTHPGSPQQSCSDQNHPMISQPNHIAIIVPRFARAASLAKDIGIYRYLGAKRWHEVPLEERRRFFHIGL